MNNTISSVDECLLYGDSLNQREQEMVEYTLAYFQFKAFRRAKYTLADEIWGTPKGKVDIGYYNIVRDVIANLDWVSITTDSPYIVDKTYSHKVNLMEIIASDVYQILFPESGAIISESFKTFIKKMPYADDPNVIKLSSNFWKRRSVAGREEGVQWDISNAVKNKKGEIQTSYIMSYISVDVENLDFLFLNYTYSKVSVLINGLGLMLDKEKWESSRAQVMKELSPEALDIESAPFEL